MKLLRLAVQNLVHKPLNLALSLLLFALGIGLISLLFIVNEQITQKFEKNLAGVDMILGAKGSPLQLVLNGLYHIDAPTGNIPLKEVTPFLNPRHPFIRKAVPLSLGDSYHGFRIVGTDTGFVSLYHAQLKEGNWFDHSMDVVIGSIVADNIHLKIGETFVSNHGLTNEDISKHEHAPFRLVGILQPTGTVCDQLLLTPTESIWDVHEHAKAKKDSVSGTDTVQAKEITTLLIQFKNNRSLFALNMARGINANTQLQAATPAIEINRLFSMMGIGFDAIKILAWVIAVVSGLSIFISLYNSLKERKHELALMRVMGARPGTLFTLIVLEGFSIAVIGYILGILTSHLLLASGSNAIFHAYKYKIDAWHFIKDEGYLFIGALFIGLIAAILPAIQAYRTNIARHL